MKVKGFTLFELLLVASLTILMAGFAIPGFKKLHHRSIIEAQASALFSFIQLGRKESISRSKNFVLCGTRDGLECDADWSSGFMLFLDNNNDDQYSEDIDQLFKYHKIESQQLSIRWRSFRGNRPVRFIPAGITWHNNGTFVICHNLYTELAKAIFLAKSGRAEMSRDDNFDGFDELRNQQRIEC